MYVLVGLGGVCFVGPLVELSNVSIGHLCGIRCLCYASWGRVICMIPWGEGGSMIISVGCWGDENWGQSFWGSLYNSPCWVGA